MDRQRSLDFPSATDRIGRFDEYDAHDMHSTPRRWQVPVTILIAMSFAAIVSLAQEVAAQSPPVPISRDFAGALPDVKAAILHATAYAANAVNLRGRESQLTVTLTNSIAGSRQEHDKDATSVVAAIAKSIEGNAAFRPLQAIHIDYVMLSEAHSDTQLVDAIDFRRDPVGNFAPHRS
jgi:hypothetical protein